MEFSIANLQPKERASFALRALYEAAGCRKYHMGRFEEYGLIWMAVCWPSSRT